MKDLKSQILNRINLARIWRESAENLMMLRSLEKSFKPLPFQKDQSALSELMLRTELKVDLFL